MRQQPDDFHDEDPGRYHDEGDGKDLEELGTPVYQGSGLSVRALTAEELQRFLDAHHGQPAELLAAAGPPWTHQDTPLGSLGPLRLQRCRCRPCRPAAAMAARAARPWPPPDAAAAGSWPPGLGAWPGGGHSLPPPASSSRSLPPGQACHTLGWLAWWPRRSRAGGCGFATPRR
jgi:hypothetical protein